MTTPVGHLASTPIFVQVVRFPQLSLLPVTGGILWGELGASGRVEDLRSSPRDARWQCPVLA